MCQEKIDKSLNEELNVDKKEEKPDYINTGQNSRQSNWPPRVLATVAILSFIVTMISLWITYRNVELVNRPFVGIENVYWWQEKETDWFSSGFKIKNYGNKPAQEFLIRNVRVIVLNLNKASLIEKLNQEKGTIPEQYFQEYLLDLRNKVYWETVTLLADYFYNMPDANKTDVTNFINSWDKILPEGHILKHNKSLLVSIIEVNNDMFDYFSKTSLLIYPSQEGAGRRYAQQMGQGGISGVEKGDNFLILYWAIKYKGLMPKFLHRFSFPVYSTYYIGYHSGPYLKMVDLTGHTGYVLREFKSWSKIE